MSYFTIINITIKVFPSVRSFFRPSVRSSVRPFVRSSVRPAVPLSPVFVSIYNTNKVFPSDRPFGHALWQFFLWKETKSEKVQIGGEKSKKGGPGENVKGHENPSPVPRSRGHP